jgi:D-hydroxyproline dehydrogenase subunit gamma
MFKTAIPPSDAPVTIYFEGRPLSVPRGTSVAAAVLQNGHSHTRVTAKKHDKRGPYCLMGVCYECLMEIDGVPNQQSCLIPVREGMQVKRQIGAPVLAPKEPQ